MVGIAALAAADENRVVQGESAIEIKLKIEGVQEEPQLTSEFAQEHSGQCKIGGFDDGLLRTRRG